MAALLNVLHVEHISLSERGLQTSYKVTYGFLTMANLGGPYCMSKYWKGPKLVNGKTRLAIILLLLVQT